MKINILGLKWDFSDSSKGAVAVILGILFLIAIFYVLYLIASTVYIGLTNDVLNLKLNAIIALLIWIAIKSNKNN